MQLGDQLRATPAAGLVDVPCHFSGDDRAERAAFQIIVRGVIGAAGAALGTDLENPAAFLDGLERGAVVRHGFGEGFLAIGIATGLHRLDGVQRVLEVRRGNDHRVRLGLFIHLLVVAVGLDGLAGLFLEPRGGFLAAQAPEIRNGDDFAVELLGLPHEGRQQRGLEPIRKPDDADADALVRADDAGLPKGAGNAAGGDETKGSKRAGVKELATVHDEDGVWI